MLRLLNWANLIVGCCGGLCLHELQEHFLHCSHSLCQFLYDWRIINGLLRWRLRFGHFKSREVMSFFFVVGHGLLSPSADYAAEGKLLPNTLSPRRRNGEDYTLLFLGFGIFYFFCVWVWVECYADEIV